MPQCCTAVAKTDSVQTSLFGTLSASNLGLQLFTLALGLLDGFNPCAMWVLLSLLALLVRLHDRRRMALVAVAFVVVSGAVYYAFMAAWLNVFLAIGMSNALRWTIAGMALAIGASLGERFDLYQGGSGRTCYLEPDRLSRVIHSARHMQRTPRRGASACTGKQ